MRKLIFVASTAMLLLALSVGPGAASTPPSAVEFQVETTTPPEGPSFGPFTATGPAVDAGLVCESGDTIDVFGRGTGFQSGIGWNAQVVKLFTCDDGSGEFFVKLLVRFDWQGLNFRWTIVGGSGAYEKLHGTGEGIGLDMGDWVLDVYYGAVHID
jgi:hypothetical protein